MYRNLREFIAEVETLGALRHVAGADPDREIGGITEVAAGMPECPALAVRPDQGLSSGFPGVHQCRNQSAARRAGARN